MGLCGIVSKCVTRNGFSAQKAVGKAASDRDVQPLQVQRDRIQTRTQPQHPYPRPEPFLEPAKDALRNLREIDAPVFERQTGFFQRSFSAEHRRRTDHFMTTQRQLIAESENEIIFAQRVNTHAQSLQAEIHDAQATGRVIGKKRGSFGTFCDKIKVSEAPLLSSLYRKFEQLQVEAAPLIHQNTAEPIHLFSTLSSDFDNLDRVLSLKSQIKFKSDRLLHYREGSADDLRKDIDDLRHISQQAHELANRLEKKYAQPAIDKDMRRAAQRNKAVAKLKDPKRRISQLKKEIQAEARHLSATGRGNIEVLYGKIQSLKDPALQANDVAETLEAKYLQPALQSAANEIKRTLYTHIQIQFAGCIGDSVSLERMDRIFDSHPTLRRMNEQISKIATVDPLLAQRLSIEYTSILSRIPVESLHDDIAKTTANNLIMARVDRNARPISFISDQEEDISNIIRQVEMLLG